MKFKRLRPSESTSAGRKEIKWWIITLNICVITGLLILGVHWGRQGLRIGGISVIPKPSLKSISAGRQLPTSTGANEMLASDVWGPYRGIVDLAHDGDTVNVKLDLGFDLTVYSRVRVKGINAPELSTAAGKSARSFAQTILPPGTPVNVLSHGWDKYGGRIDGDVFMDTPVEFQGTMYTDFAQLMLDSGHAVPYNP